MEYIVQQKREEKKDKLKSVLLTLLMTLILFLLIYYYQFVKEIQKEEPVTTMLINFGDNNNGDGTEEPANQEGSIAASQDIYIPETVETPAPEPTPVVTKPAPKEKIITGKATEKSAPFVEKPAKTPAKTTATKNTSAAKTSPSKNTTTQNKQGDGKGSAAIGNLIKGRGTKTGTQGTAGTTGNAGDPLGGNGDGDSKIGVDRKLIAYIPGTYGRGGEQPSHNCTTSGTIIIAYVVDKAGNVTSARRSSGISDPCVVTASVLWVKKYVKAERANTSSTGTYKITF